ncbi:MAG: hypothetical protein NTW49_08775 [Bacteroidia bacterium]|nr:hypothetical protein [Bacteroidia bacterium]
MNKVFIQKEHREVSSASEPSPGYRKLVPKSDGWYDKSSYDESKLALVGQMVQRIGVHFTVRGEIRVASGDTDYINPVFFSIPSWMSATPAVCFYQISSGTNIIATLSCGSNYLTFGDVDTSQLTTDYKSGYFVTGGKNVSAITRSAKCIVTAANHGFTNGQLIQFTGSGNSQEWDSLFKNKYFIVANSCKDTFSIMNAEIDIRPLKDSKTFDSLVITDGDQLMLTVLSVSGTPKNLTMSVFVDQTT